MKKYEESEKPPLIIDEESRWKNSENGQVYRPLIRGWAWESEEGSIYPFPKGTRFSYMRIGHCVMEYTEK